MSGQFIETFYSILGLTKEASTQEIKRAYRNLALQYHPDKNSSPEANEKFQKISAAYETLSDEMERTTYDEALLLAMNELIREGREKAEQEQVAKEAMEAKNKEVEKRCEAEEKATVVASEVDDGGALKPETIDLIEALSRARIVETEEKSRPEASGSKEAAQGAPKMGKKNPDGTEARIPSPSAAFPSKPRESVFPNRPKGPLPRPNRADRPATRFPVVPQAAHLAEYKARHSNPGK